MLSKWIRPNNLVYIVPSLLSSSVWDLNSPLSSSTKYLIMTSTNVYTKWPVLESTRPPSIIFPSYITLSKPFTYPRYRISHKTHIFPIHIWIQALSSSCNSGSSKIYPARTYPPQSPSLTQLTVTPLINQQGPNKFHFSSSKHLSRYSITTSTDDPYSNLMKE